MTGEVSRLFADHCRALALPDAGPILDLAAGRGRHTLPLARAGAFVVALDRNAAHLATIAASAQERAISRVRCDLEAGSGICLADRSCGAVLVFRYLHRPLCEEIVRVLRPGGTLLYETFTTAQLEFSSGPRNPEFLLRPSELPTLFSGLSVVSYEERVDPAREVALASLAAVRPSAS